MSAKTTVQILDSDLNLITQVLAFYPLDKGGTILRYTKELSDFGTCTFRISSYDTMFTSLGDILVPHAYHIRVLRDKVTIWQGAIIENSKRTKDYIEVVAAEYIWYLGDILVNRSSNNPATGTTDGIYRIFQSGTMATAVTAVMNETIARFQNTNHALASMSIGTINNPNYPPNMTDGNNPPRRLTGSWSFGDGVSGPKIQFDFHSVLYVLQSFGVYSFADFNIDENLQFNFKQFLGNDHHYDVNFVWGDHGNAVDFNITRLGQRQVNDLWGIAVDIQGNILHSEQRDESSIEDHGILEKVIPFADVKDQATLNARVQAELALVSTPDASADTFVLSEKAYPIGLYNIGDIITAKVDHTAVQYNEIKRIVGISVALNDTGRELTTVQLNTPQPWEYGV